MRARDARVGDGAVRVAAQPLELGQRVPTSSSTTAGAEDAVAAGRISANGP